MPRRLVPPGSTRPPPPVSADRSLDCLKDQDVVLDDMARLQPAETDTVLRDMVNDDKLEVFRRLAAKLGLNRARVNSVKTPEEVIESTHMIIFTLKAVVRSTDFLSLQAKRYVRGVRLIQKHTRLFLASLKVRMKKLLVWWRSAEEQARKKIRHDVARRLEASQTVATLRVVESLWLLYMDCWFPKDIMKESIRELWLRRKKEYRRRMRAALRMRGLQYGRKGKLRSSTGWQIKLADYNECLRYSRSSVSIAELCFQAVINMEGKKVFRPRSHGLGTHYETLTLDDVHQPVSYYHALLDFRPGRIHFLFFLRELNDGFELTETPLMWTSVVEQMQEAKAAYNCFIGRKLKRAKVERGVSRYALGPDGLPVSLYSEGTLPPEKRGPKGPVTPAPPSPPARRKGPFRRRSVSIYFDTHDTQQEVSLHLECNDKWREMRDRWNSIDEVRLQAYVDARREANRDVVNLEDAERSEFEAEVKATLDHVVAGAREKMTLRVMPRPLKGLMQPQTAIEKAKQYSALVPHHYSAPDSGGGSRKSGAWQLSSGSLPGTSPVTPVAGTARYSIGAAGRFAGDVAVESPLNASRAGRSNAYRKAPVVVVSARRAEKMVDDGAVFDRVAAYAQSHRPRSGYSHEKRGAGQNARKKAHVGTRSGMLNAAELAAHEREVKAQSHLILCSRPLQGVPNTLGSMVQ